MCITSPDPLDILLRKQPLPPTSSFFQKVLFLIEDGSVQSYAQKDVYSARFELKIFLNSQTNDY